MKRRLAVIMMADMVDYSRLMESDHAGTVGLIQELRERWFEPEVRQRDGDILKRLGDGWIVALPSVTDAVEAAQAVQTGLAGHPRIKLRVAVHLGEISDDGTDLYGTGINIAARLQAEAPPGGVMISQDLHRQLDQRLAENFSEAGTFELKNIAQPVAAFQWRPPVASLRRADELPVIAVEPVPAIPDTPELREAAEDLVEQLLHRLSRRTGIKVQSADSPDGRSPAYVLRGRLRAGSAKAKATLSLIQCESGSVIWSDFREGPPADLFDLIDDLADRTDSALRLEINAFDGRRIAELPDDMLSASELRTRAAHNFYKVTIAGYEKALALLERSLLLESGNGMSLAMWAHAKTRLICARFEQPDSATIEEIVERANAAVEAAPESDFVNEVRAEVRASLLMDVEGARRSIKRVRQINPNYALARHAEAELALAEGDYAAAARAIDGLVTRSERDPFLPIWLYVRAVAELLGGDAAAAVASIEEAIELRPSCRGYWLVLAEARAGSGDAAAADAARAKATQLSTRADMAAPRLPLPESERGLMALLAPR